MLKNLTEVKEYVTSPGLPEIRRKERAKNLTLVSFIIKDAFDLLADQLEKVGYTGLVFLDRVEFCLMATTQSCSEKNFQELLLLLASTSEEFKRSKLYAILNILRPICSGLDAKSSGLEHIITPGEMDRAEFLNSITDLQFFSGFLVETLIRELHAMKSNMRYSKITAIQLRELFDARFDTIVLDLVQKISTL